MDTAGAAEVLSQPFIKEPSTEQVCEETGEGVILIKDRRTGEVIGFERLYYRPDTQGQAITVEMIEATP